MRSVAKRVGELRPSQLLYSFGIGAAVDLPHLSALVLGTDYWDTTYAQEIDEPRLLRSVRAVLGRQVASLRLPPFMEPGANPLDEWSRIGVPVATFPRWLRCPACGYLGSISTGLFELKTNPYRPDQARYEHGCKPRGRSPVALPARFLLACPGGHLDDFPWVHYSHRGDPCGEPILELYERGVTGRAAEVMVKCRSCNRPDRSMAEAFGEAAEKSLPRCRGRHPHLKSFDVDCKLPTRTILLGASNAWFPVTTSVLSIPASKEPLAQKVAEFWRYLKGVASLEVLRFARSTIPEVAGAFAQVEDVTLFEEIERYRESIDAEVIGAPDVLGPEWEVLANPYDAPATDDFRLRPASTPARLGGLVEQVVLADRLREVVALIGFTRVAPPDEVDAGDGIPRAPLSRRPAEWIPCSEVRGEGVFIRLPEDRVHAWDEEVRDHPHVQRLLEAHRHWRLRWGLDPNEGWRGPRYLLVHTLAHVLIREFSLEAGYGAASLKERLYVAGGEDPMAGMLLYTAAPDSEGTLGGLVSLGEPENLSRLLTQGLERSGLCTSDPLCAEHDPAGDDSLHGAACHACLFVSETSCERGNRYLDRTLLVPTFGQHSIEYFG
jgi:hypothetical protein